VYITAGPHSPFGDIAIGGGRITRVDEDEAGRERLYTGGVGRLEMRIEGCALGCGVEDSFSEAPVCEDRVGCPRLVPWVDSA
jgi:hypothetical protein